MKRLHTERVQELTLARVRGFTTAGYHSICTQQQIETLRLLDGIYVSDMAMGIFMATRHLKQLYLGGFEPAHASAPAKTVDQMGQVAGLLQERPRPVGTVATVVVVGHRRQGGGFSTQRKGRR